MALEVEREHATHLENPNWTSVKSMHTRMLCVLRLLSGDDGTHDFAVDMLLLHTLTLNILQTQLRQSCGSQKSSFFKSILQTC